MHVCASTLRANFGLPWEWERVAGRQGRRTWRACTGILAMVHYAIMSKHQLKVKRGRCVNPTSCRRCNSWRQLAATRLGLAEIVHLKQFETSFLE